MQTLSDALSQAFRKMKKTLFSPFSLQLWFTLAFPAFLANLGSGGFGFNFMQSSSKEKISNILTEHLLLFLLILGFIVLLAIALNLVFYWLSSRGRFIFLDMLVSTRRQTLFFRSKSDFSSAIFSQYSSEASVLCRSWALS